jgi:hypothetical protein
MNEEEADYFGQMQNQLNVLNEQNQRKDNALYASEQNLFSSDEQQNLVRWQLDFEKDLDKIYHLLRGDVVGYNEKEEMVYLSQKDPNFRPFNEYGVQLIMNIMQFYINRNTILSNYDEKTIQWKVFDFGERIVNLIHNNYEDMMTTINVKDEIEKLTGKKITMLPNGHYVAKMETIMINGKIEIKVYDLGNSVIEYIEQIKKDHILQKIKLYEIIVGELVDTVHSAYLRAYHGGERESIRTARHVTQSEPIGNMQGMGMGGMQGFPVIQPKRSFSMLRPSTWGR